VSVEAVAKRVLDGAPGCPFCGEYDVAELEVLARAYLEAEKALRKIEGLHPAMAGRALKIARAFLTEHEEPAEDALAQIAELPERADD
jgi:hypothetical protein